MFEDVHDFTQSLLYYQLMNIFIIVFRKYNKNHLKNFVTSNTQFYYFKHNLDSFDLDQGYHNILKHFI